MNLFAHFRDVIDATLDQLQGMQKFSAEDAGAAAGIGLRNQCADRVVAQTITAECCFPSPDGQNSSRRHANFVLNLL